MGWEDFLDSIRDSRLQPQISTATVIRSVAVMFLSRLGSLHALEQSRPSRFWPRWLGRQMPSADTVGRVCALAEAEALRALHHQVETLTSQWMWATTLPKTRASTRTILQIGHGRWSIENQGFNELVNQWHTDHVYKHEPRAMLIFCLMAMVCLNVFMAFYRRNLKPALRKAATMPCIARRVAAELLGDMPTDPARAPPEN